jgi:hypothetical protein
MPRLTVGSETSAPIEIHYQIMAAKTRSY